MAERENYDSSSDISSETQREETMEQSETSTAVVAAAVEEAKLAGDQEGVGAASSSSSSSEDVRNGIDRLLQQHRNEIMFELRRLALGDRPVTGQDNRKNVEDFFLRTANPEAAAAAATADEHRPESVIVEVRGLVEQRPVSSLLQSNLFRRRLENTLRDSFRNVASSARASSPAPLAAAAAAAARGAVDDGSGNAAAAATQPLPSPSAASAHSTTSYHTASSSTEEEQEEQEQEEQEQEVEAPFDRATFAQLLGRTLRQRRAALAPVEARSQARTQARPQAQAPPQAQAQAQAPAPPLPPVARQEWAQSWLQQQAVRADSGATLWDNLEQAHRESIITDISELLQQQLVTSTLSGDFRDTLERHMNNRLESSGTDGRRVLQVINNLPRLPPHMRNNFSDLGLQAPAGGVGGGGLDNLSDNVSVISAAAAVTIPHAQSTAVMSREIGSLKSQLDELKSMLRLSFDLQLDIQRAIRQEVAAAVSAALAPGEVAPAATAAATSSAPSRPVDSSKCVVCLDGAADAVLYRCGHMCACYPCGMRLRQQGSNCPVCRAPIVDIIRAYTVGTPN